MRFRLSNKPSTTGLYYRNYQLKIEHLRLQDVSRGFDSNPEMPYVERNFLASAISLNPKALLKRRTEQRLNLNSSQGDWAISSLNWLGLEKSGDGIHLPCGD